MVSANQVFRDFVTEGIPATGIHKPKKSEIRELLTFHQSLLTAGQYGNTVWFATKALMTADLAHASGVPAIVYADTTAANNGIYIKAGASGSGSWGQILTYLPGYQFVTATDAGAGTANAIVATSSPRVAYTDGVQLIRLNIYEANTSGTVTVAFDGGAALTIQTASGNAPAVGGLAAGMTVLGVVDQSASVFRMLSDQASAAIQTAAEAAQAAAEAARDVALGVMTTVLDPVFPTIADAEAFAPTAAPDFIRTAGHGAAGDGGGALYIKVVSEPAHEGKFMITLDDASTEVWFELSKNQDIYAEMFGATPHQTDAAALGGGAATSDDAILNAIAFLRSNADTLNDGLTDKTVTAYTSGVLNFGHGIFNIPADTISITQDMNLTFQGQGSRGKTNFARAATTLLVTGTSDGFGIKAYGNGSRSFRLVDLDLCYATSGFTGNVLQLTGSPGSYPERCMIGTFGIRGGDRLLTARSCISVSYDEFFNPNECVFDGADIGIKIEDENRLAKFTASITSNVMTVTAVSSGYVGVGLNLWYVGIALGRSILSYGTGSGGVGTYNVTAGPDATSRDFEADLGWGGSNSHIGNCVFYDFATKSVEFRGLRGRTRQSFRNSIINPINIDADVGVDFRSVSGLSIDNSDFVGSVGNAPTVAWLNIEDCTGCITSNVFGGFALAGNIGGFLEVTGNTFNGTAGMVMRDGILSGRSNKFTMTAGSGWTIPPTGGCFIDLGPDFFSASCVASYNIQASSDAKGRVYRSISNDGSVNGALNGAAGVTVTSV